MAWFGFGKGKKKQEEEAAVKAPCCCGSCAPEGADEGTGKSAGESAGTSIGEPEVKVLGSGCARCNQLEAAVKEALRELGREDEVGHVTDYAEIAAYGVMSTPALVIGERVVSSGKVLRKDEVIALLRNP